MAWTINRSGVFGTSLAEYEMLLGAGAPAIVRNYPTVAEHGAGTPLHTMNGLAQSLGLRTIYAKDESQRLGLGSFKALGGAYAVARVVELWAERALGHKVAPARLTSAEARAAIAGQTVACATDGNHGLSVAAGAKLFGCRAVIFVHARVPRARLDAIERLGATIVVVKGSYDDSVDECSRTAAQEGWQVVSDTSWPGYEIIPGQTMQGYTVMIDECLLYREQAAKAGIEIVPKTVPADGFWSDIWMKVPWCTATWSGRATEDWMFSEAYAAGSTWNDTFWKNDRFNQLLKSARAELNHDKRRAMYVEMQTITRDDGGALIPLFANHVAGHSAKLAHPEVIAGNWEFDGYKLIERWWFA